MINEISNLKEQVSCCFCESTQYHPYYKEGEWSIVKCCGCGYVYTNQRVKEELISKYYDFNYFKDERHSSKFFENSKVKTTNTYINRFEDIENYVEKRGRFLEIGAAFGEFCRAMRERGWAVDGVEISKDAVSIASEVNGIDLYCGTFEEYDCMHRYDAIAMYQTLEHVYNPKEVLYKSFDLLKEGGVLVIEVPNVHAFDMKISRERKRLSLDLPRHVSHFYPRYLKRELEKIGFHVEYIDLYYPDFVIFVTRMVHRFKAYLKSKRTVNSETINDEKQNGSVPMAKKQLNLKISILKVISKFFPGWRFTIIARKPNESI